MRQEWTEEAPYWIRVEPHHVVVNWRESPYQAAVFNSQDFPDAFARAEAICAELNAARDGREGNRLDPDPLAGDCFICGKWHSGKCG